MTGLALPTASVQEKDPSAQLRGSAMWILTAFVAVGAAQVVAISLTGLSALSGSWLAAVAALAGFLCAMIGIGLGISAAGALLQPVPYSRAKDWPKDLELRSTEDVSFLLGTARTLDEFNKEYEKWQVAWDRQGQSASYYTYLEDKFKSFQRSYDRWAEYRKIEKLKEKYDKEVGRIYLGAVLTLIGIVLYNLAPLIPPGGAEGVRLQALNSQQDALDTRQKALSDREASVKALETKVRQENQQLAILKAQWDTIKGSEADQVKARAALLDTQEEEQEATAAALRTAALSAIDFTSSPLQATWTPKKDLANCPASTPIDVTVLRVWKESRKVQAQVVARSGPCSGLVRVVSSSDGTLTAERSTWTMP